MGAQIDLLDEIIVDNFAGGGGASTGMELATGKPVAIAVNHDPDAIRGLRRQVRFELIPAQRTPCGDLFRKCEYVCDFVYERDGRICAEDAKSPATRTPAYIIKRKLMLRVHGIYVEEV